MIFFFGSSLVLKVEKQHFDAALVGFEVHTGLERGAKVP